MWLDFNVAQWSEGILLIPVIIVLCLIVELLLFIFQKLLYLLVKSLKRV